MTAMWNLPVISHQSRTLVYTVALVVTITLSRPFAVEASGVFELRLRSFVNEYGKDSLGKCCSGSTTRIGECSGTCRTRFRVCLKQYQANIDTSTPCTYGDVVTPVLGENVLDLGSSNLANDPLIAASGFTNPIRFPFDFTWPGTFSLIVEAFHDNSVNATHDSSDRVIISRLATQRWLDVSPEWIEDQHSSQHSKMVYEYRVTCAAHYYGKGCENLCRPRDDNFGHYRCSPTGERVCLAGWKGDYCATPHCLPGCDEQHGHCSRPNECTCHNGWTGPFCDQCVRYPGCLHGTCQRPWECLCDEGWGGLFCNQDLNFCTNHKPCQNGGTCFNTGQGSYTCSCAPGFTGTDCENPVLDCHSRPCLNGGTCVTEKRPHGNATLERVGGSGTPVARNYRCTCQPGWRGRHCEVSSKSCRDSPCSRGATCEDDSIKGYTCHCPTGFTGPDCDRQIDECASNPCANGGTCTDLLGGFKCTCQPGFTGPNCQTNIDDCVGQPCRNGGTCVDLINKFHCQCVPGYAGPNCQKKVDYCVIKPCANGGRCTSGTNDWECACRPGFTGKDCSIYTDECKDNPCKNGGLCRKRVSGFVCECRGGWWGETCRNRPGSEPELISSPAVPPSGASSWSGNLSKHVAASAEVRDAGLTTEHVVVIATISTAVPAFVLVAALAVLCMKRRQKREQARADEEARLQNERNAVHSSMSKRSALLASGALGCGGSVVSCGAGDPHMIKNTWTAPKSGKNQASARDEMDGCYSGATSESDGCAGYKPEPINTKQLNTEAAAHRASQLLYSKSEKECSLGLGCPGLESKRSSSLFSASTTDSCCAAATADTSLLKRPNQEQQQNVANSEGVYVIDDHYRHDQQTLNQTQLATEV